MRQAFTLYEVLMASLILALGLLGSLALFPKALDLQKTARQRVLAASVAYDIVTRHASGFDHNARTGRDDHVLVRSVNSPNLLNLGLRNSGNVDKGNWRIWQWTGSGGNQQALTSERTSTDADFRFHTQDSMRNRSMGPVPPEILERLDSDFDEIRHLAEEGIGVFYLWPYAVNNSFTDGEDLSISDSTAHPLIFAAVGHSQINASFHSPSEFHSYEIIDEDGGYDYPLSFLWRRKARFHSSDPASDPRAPEMVPGETRWRGYAWEPWRWKYWNAWKHWDAGGRVDSAILGYYEEENNAAFAFPFKYYLWDYELQVVDPYFEWERLARTGSHPSWAVKGRNFRDFAHGTTGFFDPQEDSDVAFPLLPKLSNSLFVPFKPSHRCRELVFWSVNWKDYEDAELIDEGLQNDIALHQVGTQGYDGDVYARLTKYVHSYRFLNNITHGRRPYLSSDSPIGHEAIHPVVWGNNKDALATYERWFDWHWHIDYAIARDGDMRKPDGTLLTNVPYRDRNFNENLDLGPVPRSVRLRAKTIARFVTYDKRLHATY